MRRLPGLDLLRAIAIISVMFSHAALFDIISGDNPLARYGWMGVDLFFVLSGFLIGGQLFRPYARGETRHLGLFYARRLLRTFPPYLVVLALYFLVPGFAERKHIQPLWQFLTFTENLFVDMSHAESFSHVWSLCVEEHFYLIAPLVVWLLMRWPMAWKVAAVCGAILACGIVLRGYIWMHDLAPLQHSDALGTIWIERIYYPTWTRLDGLLGGVVLAMIKAFRPALWERIARRGNVSLGLGLAGVAASIYLFRDQMAFVPSLIGYPLLAAGMTCLVAAGASATSMIGRFRLPGAGFVAAMAYSLYLTHKEIYHLVQTAFGPQLTGHPVWAFAAYGGGALAAGAILYVLVERPALRWRDRIVDKRQPALAASAPA